MDYYTILAQRTLLASFLPGERLSAVRLHESYSVYLGFAGGLALKLAAVPDMPYLHQLDARFIPKKNAFDWQPSLFAGARLADIALTPGDRVLAFRFDNGLSLIFELTGRYANCVLVGPDGIIIGAIRKITAAESGYRELRQGVPYLPPPPRSFPDPLTADTAVLRAAFRTAGGDTLADALAAGITVGSRPIAREAAIRAGFDPAVPPDAVTDVDLDKIVEALAGLARTAAAGGDGGTVLAGPDGLPREVVPFRLMQPGPNDRWFESLDDAVRHYARERETGLQVRGYRQSALAALKREERSLTRTLAKVREDRGGDREPELLEHEANALLTNLRLIRRGMDRVTVPDPYGGVDLDIALDPALDGVANAERLFTRARKFRTAAAMTERRVAAIEHRLEAIAAERERVATLEDPAELKTLAAQASRSMAHADQAGDEDRVFPRRFVSVSRLEIVVGRHNEENDRLVRWARKNDLWLHAQGVAGSHVILRSPGQNPDRHSIEQAAAIAAYYSKARTSGVVPVVCTPVKYVVKRRGQGPGEVTYTHEKVYFVEPGLPGGGEPGG